MALTVEDHLLSILKLLCLSALGDRFCPASNCTYVLPKESSLCEHFLRCHIDLPFEITPDSLSTSNISIVTDTDHSDILPINLSILTSVTTGYFFSLFVLLLYVYMCIESCTLPARGIT